MQLRPISFLAIILWILAVVSQGQSPPGTGLSLESAFREIDTLARNEPENLPHFLRLQLAAKPPIQAAGALVGRSFKQVGERITVPLARSIIFESVYADQEAVLEIVRLALLNSPARLHPQIVAAAIVSTIDPEQSVIVEFAAFAPGIAKEEGVDGKGVEPAEGKAALPSREGPLTYRPAGANEPGTLALGDAILAAATSVDSNLTLALFPIALNGYFLPEFNPPGRAANGPYDLRNPIDQGVLDPRLPVVKPVSP